MRAYSLDLRERIWTREHRRRRRAEVSRFDALAL